MTTVYDVPPSDLIKGLARELKDSGKVSLPDWAAFVKTGANKDMPPDDPDWWYVRCASVLRHVYVHGPVGVSRLRSHYGGRTRNRVSTGTFAKGSGSVVREALQQLEKAGYVKKFKNGRQVTPEGQSFMDGVAFKVKGLLVESTPGLAKY
ncbi:MAG: 30S ribosomal protein S19e [Methanosaeta sp. PtaB.Bin039]|nr:MAG: 30S ribosomal protein S19e [Methanosaeta sp. PtaB.Bin039]OPY45486.1 MAG: 30S ribosomal protein S19e [Methanosaeta sp. PtaU1.Bin028]HOT07148.1 30S ribosomal protein S19e [Methanotrichaceae archaeon]HQF16869.1 30S ribosomal protein S19e [Methanotrichaceae archaeon]HQI91435.1 30S ribosomal protein S19e [Methanotrichaceae archaeon]